MYIRMGDFYFFLMQQCTKISVYITRRYVSGFCSQIYEVFGSNLTNNGFFSVLKPAKGVLKMDC